MSEPKHSPGPWYLPSSGVPQDRDGQVVALMTHHPRSRADAILIAAAPELLDAAKLALNAAEDCIRSEYEGTGDFADLMAGLEPVRAAIAKAEGR